MPFITKFDEIRKTDKTWKSKSDLEKQDKYVDTALVVSRIVLYYISYYGRVAKPKIVRSCISILIITITFLPNFI